MELNTEKAIVISIYNNKGGVSKTTSCANIAKVLADKGYRVLVVDNDGQFNLTFVMTGVKQDSLSNIARYTMYDLMTKDDLEAKDCIIKSRFPGIDIICSDDNHNDTPDAINNKEDNSRLLKYKLESVLDDYDFILIDCSPTRDKNVFNSLFASRVIWTPVECQEFSEIALGNLLKQVAKLNKRRKDNNKLLHYVFFSKIDNKRKSHNDFIRKQVSEMVGSENVLLPTISLLSLYSKSFTEGVTAIDYEKDTRGKIEYEELTESLLMKLQQDL